MAGAHIRVHVDGLARQAWYSLLSATVHEGVSVHEARTRRISASFNSISISQSLHMMERTL